MKAWIILFFSFQVTSAFAFHWQDLWQTPDQQGQLLMQQKEFARAKKTFQRPDWIATAAYKEGDYQSAAELYKTLKTQEGYYNQGNALAYSQAYQQAIEAYDKALALNPNNQDAIYNRKLVSDLLEKEKQQNKEQQDKEQQNKRQQDKEQQNKGQQNKGQQDKEQQNKGQQDKEQQNKGQQDQEQQNQEQKKKASQSAKKAKDSQQKKSSEPKEAPQSNTSREKQQAKEQWLKLIPDDPGGLMREKFLRDHLKREGGLYQ